MSLGGRGPTPGGSAPDDRLAGLRRMKLRALVRDHWAAQTDADLADGAIPGGATLYEVGGPHSWLLVDDGAVSGLGAALVWGWRHGHREMHILVEDRGDRPAASAIVARRAAEFLEPPTVWRVQGRALLPARPAEDVCEPGGTGDEVLPEEVSSAMATQISAHGADPVVEHGVLRAEILGVEVARVVPDQGGGWRLAVGVGRHDRDARSELRPGESTANALDAVVQLVRTWRAPGARRHPANTLATERWLRAVVMAHPEIAGAASLSPVPPPLPRTDLRTPSAAGAVGVDTGGRAIVVVCSTGVDVDLVPTAADIRHSHAPDARLVLVMPAADAYPITRQLAGSLRRPAEIRTVGSDWPSLLETPRASAPSEVTPPLVAPPPVDRTHLDPH